MSRQTCCRRSCFSSRRLAAAFVVGAAWLLPVAADATMHNPTPDLPWSSGNTRPNQCCGTIAAANLLILVDEDAGRTVGDKTTTDELYDETEKETNGDTDKSTVSNTDMVKGVKKILKKRGYTGVVESILQEGAAAITFQRILDELADDEKLLLLVVSKEPGANPDDGIGHWLAVTGADKDDKTVSVTDPNTRAGQSKNPRDPGKADTHAVDTTNTTLTLGYDFASEQNKEGSTRVQIIDIVKVSDVEDAPKSPQGTGGGGSGGGKVIEKSGGNAVSIDPILIDSLFIDASTPGGVDAPYVGDPILGASLRISDLTLLNPLDVLTVGALLSGGLVEIVLDAVTLFSATFDAFTLVDSAQLGANQAILDDPLFNNAIGSDWLDAFEAQFLADPTLLAQLVLQPADTATSLLQQLGFLQAPFDLPVGFAAYLGATDLPPTEAVDVRSVTGRSLAVGVLVPEPATWTVLLLGLAGVSLGRRAVARRG